MLRILDSYHENEAFPWLILIGVGRAHHKLLTPHS